MKTIAILAACGAALFVSAPAAAQNAARGRAVAISTAGLDLATTFGREMLDARIRAAAATACAASPADLRAQTHAGQCRADMVAAARARRDEMLARRGAGTMVATRR